VNVCFISHSARLGGAELVLLETIEVLRESGVGCYAVLPSQGPLLAELEKLHVPVLVTSYALWSALKKFSLLRQLRALLNMAAKSLLIARQAARWNCDILYSNTETVCVGAFAAALLGRPHVWHLHEFGPRMGLKFIFGERRSHGVINRFLRWSSRPLTLLPKKPAPGCRPRRCAWFTALSIVLSAAAM
jgi:Glycosyltransferase Family 4